MTENLVATRRTTPTPAQFASALLRYFPDATKAAAGVLWAHFAGETGDGRFCWNWDLANVKHLRGDAHDYVSLAGVWEGLRLDDENGDGVIDAADKPLLIARLVRTGLWSPDPSLDHAKAVGAGKVSLIATPANSATWFRAYASLEAGMAEFISSKRAGQWKSTWPLVVSGDSRAYALELGRLHYYTASPTAYAAALVAKQQAWMALSAFDDALAELQTATATPTPALETVDTDPDLSGASDLC